MDPETDPAADPRAAGAGGGGGAVVVGFIKDLAATDIVSVTVGAGGKGGSATSYSVTNDAGAGHADPGSNSVIRVNGTTYITAYGGAGDGGKDSAGVANGGSNSGVRKAQSAIALKSVTVIGAGVEGLVSDVVAYANKGGPGKATDSGYAAAGGGGAHPTEGEGHQSSGSSYGGHGGYGYESYITDSLVYYGAGGGGGTGKSSGTGTVDWGNALLLGCTEQEDLQLMLMVHLVYLTKAAVAVVVAIRGMVVLVVLVLLFFALVTLKLTFQLMLRLIFYLRFQIRYIQGKFYPLDLLRLLLIK